MNAFFVAFFKFYKGFTLFPVMIPTFTPFLFALPTFTQFVRRDFLGVFFIWIIRILTFTPFNSGLHLLHRSRLTICRLCIIFAQFLHNRLFGGAASVFLYGFLKAAVRKEIGDIS